MVLFPSSELAKGKPNEDMKFKSEVMIRTHNRLVLRPWMLSKSLALKRSSKWFFTFKRTLTSRNQPFTEKMEVERGKLFSSSSRARVLQNRAYVSSSLIQVSTCAYNSRPLIVISTGLKA